MPKAITMPDSASATKAAALTQCAARSRGEALDHAAGVGLVAAQRPFAPVEQADGRLTINSSEPP